MAPTEDKPSTPFTIHYTLTRRQRIGDLFPWLPALAGSIGFGVGVIYLGSLLSWVLLIFLLLPVVLFRGLFRLLFEFVFLARQPVELAVRGHFLDVVSRGVRLRLTLDDIIQVYRSNDTWQVLHHAGATVVIPVDAIGEEQVEFLKSFARRAFLARRERQQQP